MLSAIYMNDGTVYPEGFIGAQQVDNTGNVIWFCHSAQWVSFSPRFKQLFASGDLFE